MSDYTPTTEQVREEYATRMAPHLEEARREAFDRWAEQVKAEAWDEGHRTPQELGPDDCQCYAWYEGECACGLFGTGDILTPNPYRKEQDA